MKKVKAFILILYLIIASAYLITSPQRGAAFIKTTVSSYDITMKQDLLSLMMAYPENISNVEQSDGQVYIVIKSGKKILYDDKKVKSVETKIAYPDLQDMMEQAYPVVPIKKLMDKNHDPGRARVYSLLNEVYGASQKQIENNLANVKVGYGTFQFNEKNQAAEALKNVMRELSVAAENRSDIRSCIYPCNGTYNYRVIAGTNRLSPHSYGIAVDLARDKRDYWQWASREEGQKRLSSYPVEIAALFEKHNFIWGGKWGHFDILHFEYRPEIIIKARCFGSNQDFQQVWYQGVPLEDEYIRNCIKKIDEKIK
ncbi:MAG TPA: M15 family metallopeptidase [Clostridia bacterium]|nr:M15 family metallopeptidase [Clostridia bacterium]